MASLDLRWLCAFLTAEVEPYTAAAKKSFSLSKEDEKKLLIHLSLVYRRLQFAAKDPSSNLQKEFRKNGLSKECTVWSTYIHSAEVHDCLEKVTCILVASFSFSSPFIRHLSEKVLQALSSYLSSSVTKWRQLLDWMWLKLQTAASNTGSSTSASGALTYDNPLASPLYNNNGIVSLSHPDIFISRWPTIEGALQFFQRILKHLKKDSRVKIYMAVMALSLLDVCLGILDAVYHVPADEKSSGPLKVMAVVTSNTSSLTSYEGLGMLLRFLCTLVRKCTSEDVNGLRSDDYLILSGITKLIPKVVSSQTLHYVGDKRDHAADYLRHKTLTLMMMICDRINHHPSTLMLWLHLLWEGFEDILCHPLWSVTFTTDHLEGSPFTSSMAGRHKDPMSCNHHLQRLSILFLLKCSFILAKLSCGSAASSVCPKNDSVHFSLPFDEDGSSQIGSSILCKWLYQHVPHGIDYSQDLVEKACWKFRCSFVKLFLDEDDLLFEVLLHLMDYWLLIYPLGSSGNGSNRGVKRNTLSLCSDIFNPIFLFHLFLDGVKYDHLVLLDYLISKDTGVLCAQYLLRCVRTISSSWCSFVEFKMPEEEVIESLCKKRKTDMKEHDFFQELHGEPGSYFLNKASPYLKEPMGSPSKLDNVKCASDCLLSLKRSLENLHQKKLFPYNPVALLRSLARFEELSKQKGSKTMMAEECCI